MRNYYLYIFTFLLLIITSCSKEIDLKIPESKSQIVVEGYIEQNQYPIVYLTMSMPFFSKIDSASLYEQIMSIAKVTVTCEDKSEILTLKRDDSYYPPLFYQGTQLKGEIGKTYELKIEYGGNVITASTSIGIPPHLDSLSFQPESLNDSVGHIYLEFKDDPVAKNYYRTFTMALNKDKRFYPTLVNTFDDQYFNGEQINFKIYKGYKTLDDFTKQNIYFDKGDTIIFRFCSINKEQFDFWNSYQGKVLNLTSFASSTNKMLTNINGGLGIWGGLGVTYYQIIAK